MKLQGMAIARGSLVVVWLMTAIVSLLELNGRGSHLLSAASVPVNWHTPVIVAGSLVDFVVGLAIWRWHRSLVYSLALINLVVMTMVASVLLPTLWLDPLGSLLKNVPIAALLWMLREDAKR